MILKIVGLCTFHTIKVIFMLRVSSLHYLSVSDWRIYISSHSVL